ncbi:uncharacterized protein TRIADDRAFT_50484 [Trichoplax adhaerens]|uniref:Uncharacterized protein n=1 Tax=Trichoplax adhaerens TaxID=10228 RepID=B3S2F0_TRIAD|nr:hypothetical protein TRIADDRAFT_50484 [Trichoplax adhaerens]EDV23405.1 hypothetical protein TRIADDRAFT_50484 [Trichoplax adhaerens]|eukprot:XP_002114315.1 hypothetical protein TRIADDRAFT_50484 [Trichoplax adhaerens]
MQVSAPNDIKIYNLSAGKSLPEWLSERRRRSLVKRDIDLQRRIELIQDFTMPGVSHRIKVSRDGQYILATGTYQPRVRCYDVSQLSLKFERCMNSQVIQFDLLNDDYTKMIFMHDDRYIEFHNKGGSHYQCRIPCFGRDMAYHYPSCDLYIVGVSNEIYRLNLELGRFMAPLKTNSRATNCCQINPEHQFLTIGTEDGTVEVWDPRSRNREGLLDTNLSADGHHEITAVKYRDGLNLALGTSTGKVLVYDIRNQRPYVTKDHEYGEPIKSLEFNHDQDYVLSADSKIMKIWQRQTGKLFTYIQPETDINSLCTYPNSGLLFFATEAPNMLVYYIPELGPAPRWCGFLDNLTEELEEDQQPTVYEDYKFVTVQDLESLGLSHLIGTNLLRAYMHGFFIDIRLYHRAKAIIEPFAFNEYRKQRINQQLDKERESRAFKKNEVVKALYTL